MPGTITVSAGAWDYNCKVMFYFVEVSKLVLRCIVVMEASYVTSHCRYGSLLCNLSLSLWKPPM